uniref:prenyltransferase/squalene oxidase repeat-containing protein n=1 Tax=Thermogutta sp. TaxID=1962930 RepID=UPI00321F992C
MTDKLPLPDEQQPSQGSPGPGQGPGTPPPPTAESTSSAQNARETTRGVPEGKTLPSAQGNAIRAQGESTGKGKAQPSPTAVAAAAKGIKADNEREQKNGRNLLWEILHWMPSWFVSMVVHAVALLVMAMITIPAPRETTAQTLVVAPGQNEQLEEVEELLDEPPQDINLATDLSPVEVASNVDSSQDVSPFNDQTAAMASVELSPIGVEHAPQTDLLANLGALSGDAFSGRGAGKERLARLGGASEGSERAVALALQWLANHQLPDGGWSFDHTKAGGCNGQCRNPGNLPEARAAATALALLPFLGSGQTHREGKYAKNVRAGLYFLITNRMKISPEGGSFLEDGGNMYSQGLASIVLCEAYGMTHDRVLAAPAQQALNFICNAQDPVGGGWRYQPRQKGDTSVVGWQLMALKSGMMAYLQVPKVTVQKAQVFLDSVQSDGGAA